MNELVICTERGIYAALEHVIGIVYLKIAHPSKINGLQLQLLGNLRIIVQTEVINECLIDKTYVLSDNQDEPYSIGYHAFPFMITLPPNLSGSLFIENVSGETTYRVETTYKLIARASNCHHFFTETCIYIYRHNLDEIWDDDIIGSNHASSTAAAPTNANSTSTSSTVQTQLGLPHISQTLTFGQLRKSELKMAIYLNKPVFEFGETMALNLMVNNGAAKLIESISCKLIRCLEVTFPQQKNKQCIESVLWGQLEPSVTPDKKELRISIGIPIPIPSCQEFSPTTCNAYLKCYYFIDVKAPIAGSASTGSNRQSQLHLRLRVPCIVPHDNPFWSQASLPYWSARARVAQVDPTVQITRPHLGALFFAPSSVLEHYGITKY